MHCCNWAVLSSITCVASPRNRPRKAFPEADSRRTSPSPVGRSYIVYTTVTKSPDSLPGSQTRAGRRSRRFTRRSRAEHPRLEVRRNLESRLEDDEPLLGHLADGVGGPFLRV